MKSGEKNLSQPVLQQQLLHLRRSRMEAHIAADQGNQVLALDQIVNNAATIRHMSGGQFAVPLVIRMATGAGRQLAAQHSHSLEGWYAHIPGLKVVTPATSEDARFMLGAALADPNPVLIFEHVMLYNRSGVLPPDAGPVDIRRAVVRRPGKHVTLVTYGGTLF